MSAVDSAAAVERINREYRTLTAEEFGVEALIVLTMLAHHAPGVANFLMDRLDHLIDSGEATTIAQGLLAEQDQRGS